MTREQADFFSEVAEGEVYEGYSGRGMCGEETSGVESEESDAYIMLNLWRRLHEAGAAPPPPRNLRRDSLGRGTIIY